MNVHTKTKRAGAVLGVGVLALVMSACRFTGFNDAPSRFVGAISTQWLLEQQENDGGFELANFSGFETPDAILAIAENAQQQAAWNPTQALNAVRAARTNGNDPLHNIDDLVDDTSPAINAGTAAKIIVLVAKPLGLSVTNFNPDGDTAKNLVNVVNAGAAGNGSYGAFNATLYAAIAKRLVDGAVPANTLALIRNGQEASGGWDFNGEPTGNDADVDTTALAIQALVAAGVSRTDADLRQGLNYLAHNQGANGAWQAFGTPDPNSTSTAIFAITASGFDPSKPCWRNVVAPGLSGNPYTSPMVWLQSQLNLGTPGSADFGRINSQNDAFGVNTFATSQAIQAFRRGWVPVTPLLPQACS
jgi:hypothetical protein